MFRQFLVALAVLLGAGVSIGQAPVTYSVAGAAVVDALLNMPDLRTFEIAEWYAGGWSGSGPTRSMPVTWNYTVDGQQATYLGELQWGPGNLDVYIDNYYLAVCQTQNQSDCGLFGTGVTGTSLDRFKVGQGPFNMTVEWIASTGECASCNVTEPSGDLYFCHSSVSGSGFGIAFVKHDWHNGDIGGTQYYGYQRSYSGGVAGAWSRGGSSDPGAIVSGTTGYLSSMCAPTYPKGYLTGYINGTSLKWMGYETENADALGGIARTLAEHQAELDRLRVEAGGEFFQSIAGLSLVPTPEPAAVVADDGALDPGTCEDGWFLTKVVCEIRTQGERLWTFVSHDAWVPEVPWEQRMDALQSAAALKVPFGFLPGAANDSHISFLQDTIGYESIIDAYLGGAEFTAEDCPKWSVQPRQLMPDLWGSWGQGDVPVVGNFCTTAYGTWMHETGRGWIHAFLIAGVTIWFLLQAVGIVRGR